MTKLKEEIPTEFDEYVLKVNKREENKLTKQKREGIAECRRVLKLLKKKPITFNKEIKMIDKRMIPYITRQKWMPPSYRRFLDMWQDRYFELGGKNETQGKIHKT